MSTEIIEIENFIGAPALLAQWHLLSGLNVGCVINAISSAHFLDYL